MTPLTDGRKGTSPLSSTGNNGNEARDKLILDNLEWARIIAKRMTKKYGKLIPFDDVFGYATLGLIDAAQKYKPSPTNTFKSYASIRVVGAIIDGLRKEDIYCKEIRRDLRVGKITPEDLIPPTRVEQDESQTRAVFDGEVQQMVDRAVNYHLSRAEKAAFRWRHNGRRRRPRVKGKILSYNMCCKKASRAHVKLRQSRPLQRAINEYKARNDRNGAKSTPKNKLV